MLKNHLSVLELGLPEEMQYSVVFRNAKDKDKFIKRTEQIIRSSMEYRDYIVFLRENVDMTKCAFFNAVSNEQGKRIRIEIHHAPFTLYDYVKAVVERFESEGLPLNDLLIANEVMELHYNNQVGLIPLSKTIHEMVHNSDKIPIPLNMIYGDYRSFLASDKYSSLEQIDYLYDKLEIEIAKTKAITPETFDAIKKEFKYINIEDAAPVEKRELIEKSEVA